MPHRDDQGKLIAEDEQEAKFYEEIGTDYVLKGSRVQSQTARSSPSQAGQKRSDSTGRKRGGKGTGNATQTVYGAILRRVKRIMWMIESGNNPKLVREEYEEIREIITDYTAALNKGIVQGHFGDVSGNDLPRDVVRSLRSLRGTLKRAVDEYEQS